MSYILREPLVLSVTLYNIVFAPAPLLAREARLWLLLPVPIPLSRQRKVE
jgi:hypothetical protein